MAHLFQSNRRRKRNASNPRGSGVFVDRRPMRGLVKLGYPPAPRPYLKTWGSRPAEKRRLLGAAA